MPKVTLREATYEDRDELMRLLKDFHYATRLRRYILWEDCIPGWEAWLSACIENENMLLGVVASEKKLHAMIGCVVAPMFFTADVLTGFELVLWVDEAARGKGCAKKLIQGYEKWAKEKGARFCTLGSNIATGWKPTQKLYQSMGYGLEEKHYVREI